MDLKELENVVSFAAIVLWRNYLTALKAHHGARWCWVTLIVIRRYVYATFYNGSFVFQKMNWLLSSRHLIPFTVPSLFDNYVTKPQFKSDLVEEKRGG